MNRVIPFIFLFSTLTVLTGCDTDSNDPEGQEAYVMYINAAPNAGSIVVDNVEVNHDVGPVGYGNHSGYTIAYLENVNYVIKGTGLSPTTYATITSPPWQDGKYYTVVVYTDVNSSTGVSLYIAEDQIPVPNAGSTAMRFMNFAHDSPNLDLATTGGSPLFIDVPFYGSDPNTAITNYVTNAAGSYELEIRETGTSTALYDLWPNTFAEQRAYTVVASGNAGSTLLTGINIQVFENELQ